MFKLHKEILQGNDGKYSIRAFIAYLTTLVYCTVGILDATTPGVNMDSEFYWGSITLICAMVAARVLQYFAEIRTGNKSVTRTESTTTITEPVKEESQ